jgi:hypothetical protein
MEQQEMRPGIRRNASAAVIVPIAAMLAGLFLGMARASGLGPDPLIRLACVIRWVATGFFAGLALILLMVLHLRRRDAISIRRLMLLIAIAAVIAWFFARVLFTAIGYEGF